jgi:hypothetical protein
LSIRGQYEAKKAEEAGRAQEKLPKPWWWLGQRDPIARFTKWLVLWTALLFIGTVISAAILFKTDNTLQETLTATQRPWVSIVAEFDGPIIRKQSRYLAVNIRLSLKNSGHTPAISTTPAALMFSGPNHYDFHGPAYDMLEVQKQRCQQAFDLTLAVGHGQGSLLFPGETIINTVSALWERGTKRPVARAYPDAVACVQYKFSFGEQIKQSSVLYAVVGSTEHRVSINPSRTPIDTAGFRLSAYGSDAN